MKETEWQFDPDGDEHQFPDWVQESFRLVCGGITVWGVEAFLERWQGLDGAAFKQAYATGSRKDRFIALFALSHLDVVWAQDQCC